MRIDNGVEVKEFDGGRSMLITSRDGYVIVEMGETSMMFERGVLNRAAERALNVTVLDMGGIGDEVEELVAF